MTFAHAAWCAAVLSSLAVLAHAQPTPAPRIDPGIDAQQQQLRQQRQQAHQTQLRPQARVPGADVKRSATEAVYPALDTDFSENRHGQVDEALDAVQKIERGELASFDTGGQSFWHHITQEGVRFEHNVFGECPEWPIWCCTLAQYKAALQGYRRFLDMPRSIESELIIDLPEGEARCD